MYSCTRDLFLGTGTNGTLLLDPAGDLLNLFAICPHKWQDTLLPMDIQIYRFQILCKGTNCLHAPLLASPPRPFIFHLKAASKLPASINIGFGVFVSNGEYSAVLFTQGC